MKLKWGMSSDYFRGIFKRVEKWLREVLEKESEGILNTMKLSLLENKGKLCKEMFSNYHYNASVTYISSWVGKELKWKPAVKNCEECSRVCYHKTQEQADAARKTHQPEKRALNYTMVTELTNGGLTYSSSELHYLVAQALHALSWCTRHETHSLLLFDEESMTSAQVPKMVISKLLEFLILTNKSQDDTREEGVLNKMFKDCDACKQPRQETIIPIIISKVTNVGLKHFAQYMNRCIKASLLTLSMLKEMEKKPNQKTTQSFPLGDGGSYVDDPKAIQKVTKAVRAKRDMEHVLSPLPTPEEMKKVTSRQPLCDLLTGYGMNGLYGNISNLKEIVELLRLLESKNLLSMRLWRRAERVKYLRMLKLPTDGQQLDHLMYLYRALTRTLTVDDTLVVDNLV